MKLSQSIFTKKCVLIGCLGFLAMHCVTLAWETVGTARSCQFGFPLPHNVHAGGSLEYDFSPLAVTFNWLVYSGLIWLVASGIGFGGEKRCSSFWFRVLYMGSVALAVKAALFDVFQFVVGMNGFTTYLGPLGPWFDPVGPFSHNSVEVVFIFEDYHCY